MKATRKLVALFSAAVLALAAKAAAPSVVVNSVTQAYPYGTSVQTKYTVTAGDEGYSLKFYATINNEVYDVTDSVTPSADLLAAGEHTVTWTAPSNKLDTNAGLALKVVETGAAAGPETVAELKTYSDDTFATKNELGDYLTTTTAASTYLTTAAATSSYQPKGDYLESYTETDPTVKSWAKADTKPTYTFTEITSKPTTLAGYGITDANITSGTITLGSSSITPLTAQSLSAYSTTAQMNEAIAAATNVVASSAGKTDKYASATRSANLASSTHQYMIVDMTTTNSYSVTYKAFTTLSEANTYFNTDEYKTTKMAFRFIPAGTYVVGNADGSNYAQTFCKMPKGYYIGVFPVTQSQWRRVMECVTSNTAKTPAAATEGSTAYAVNYQNMRGTATPDAAANGGFAKLFTDRVNKSGVTFDLPTEMMWEVAARAGTDTTWFFGTTADFLSSYARCSSNSSNSKASVGSYCPNQWGIYDMYGNVWERCRDYYTSTHPDTTGQAADGQTPFSGTTGVVSQSGGSTGVLPYTVAARGGGYDGDGTGCRSSCRGGGNATFNASTYAHADRGFRLSRIVQ